jgi:hypothetical protein
MTTNVQIYPLARDQIVHGSQSVQAIYGPVLGGRIANPASAVFQGIVAPESIFVSMIGPGGTNALGPVFELTPGQSMKIPSGTLAVWVNAATTGHKFGGVAIFDDSNFTPPDNGWPPTGPTTQTGVIPSYLYWEYSDDDDLQAFVSSYNQFAQLYVTWFATIELPNYTASGINGALLDWVALGLYGMKRPVLPYGQTQNLGPLNTIPLDSLVLNREEIIGPQNFFLTDDDTFRRILTWHLMKGDGKVFNIRWLKRRVEQFLLGTDGKPINPGTTYEVSVTFGSPNIVNINLQQTLRYATGGAILNAGALNEFELNELDSKTVQRPISPLVPVLKAAIDAGVLELPFQYVYHVNIN